MPKDKLRAKTLADFFITFCFLFFITSTILISGCKKDTPQTQMDSVENTEVGVNKFQEQSSKRDCPHPNPTEPPLDKRYLDLTPKQLIPHVLDLYGPDGPDGSRLACAWFIWKTKNTDDKQTLRNELADRLVEEIREVEKDPKRSLHDVFFWAEMFGPLGAREQVLSLLKDKESLDCCYGPKLIRSLGECGKLEDVPILFKFMESEHAGGTVNYSLEMLTGVKIPLKGGVRGRPDKKAWQDWWKKNK